MISAFADGFSFPLSGMRDLRDPALRKFVLLPLALNVVLFALVIWGSASLFSAWMDALLGWLPNWLDFLDWLLWPVFILTVMLMMFYLFTLVANLIGSPFNGLLAERAERHYYPAGITPQPVSLWKEAARAPVVELRKLLYFLVRAIPLLLLFLVPGINAVAPFLWFGFCAWMLALEYMDYPMSNHLVPLTRQRYILAEQRPLALGFGTAVLILTLIPVVNFVVMPAAVVGATRLWAERLRPAAGL